MEIRSKFCCNFVIIFPNRFLIETMLLLYFADFRCIIGLWKKKKAFNAIGTPFKNPFLEHLRGRVFIVYHKNFIVKIAHIVSFSGGVYCANI